MTPGDSFSDRDGDWEVLAVWPGGTVRSAVLLRPSQAFKDRRTTPSPPPEPGQEAINAFAAGDMLRKDEALQAMAVRLARP